MIDTILFDLDGTLLPLDQDEFVHVYFKALAGKFVKFGYKPELMIKGVSAGLEAMVRNDGSMTNEERFWEVFSGIVGKEILDLKPEFDNFYKNEFWAVQDITKPTEYAKKSVEKLKNKGYNLIAATNPVFPEIATRTRLKWAGVDPDDFSLITTYENSSFSKPNINYYREILKTVSKQPEQCIMVGNDIQEDMCSLQLGLKVYLITDCLINKNNIDINTFEHGSFEQFEKIVDEMSNVK